VRTASKDSGKFSFYAKRSIACQLTVRVFALRPNQDVRLKWLSLHQDGIYVASSILIAALFITIFPNSYGRPLASFGLGVISVFWYGWITGNSQKLVSASGRGLALLFPLVILPRTVLAGGPKCDDATGRT
jgi:hypothetical protein